ncbi:hypothetical protein Q4485_09935 [Granulosicoccaceae sp. 1_MG-2023]|nr:hypothetical protein [Granulosicoccaceae sp. 1_MG-2023]
MLRKLAQITFIGLACLSKSHAADRNDDYFVLNTVAIHFENYEDRNAAVPGVGWERSPTRGLGWHVGTFSDSFGSQALYSGVNYATPPARILTRDVRLLLGATVLHKQYHPDTDPETKVVPLPAMEVSLTDKVVLNISGSPEIDYNGSHSNAVMFFQVKMNVE